MEGCVEIQKRLSLFADGELGPDEHSAVRTHLRQCVDCSGVLADLERLATAARELGPMAPPDHVWLEVAGGVRLSEARSGSSPTPSQRRSPLWQWAGLAAALVLVTFGLYALQGGPDSSPPDEQAAWRAHWSRLAQVLSDDR